MRGEDSTGHLTRFWFSESIIRNLVRPWAFLLKAFWNGVFKWSCRLNLTITLSFLCQNSNSFFFALRGPAAVWRARGLQHFLPNHPDWNKHTVQSCTCTSSSCTVKTSACKLNVVRHIPDVRNIRPGDGLFLNFGQTCKGRGKTGGDRIVVGPQVCARGPKSQKELPRLAKDTKFNQEKPLILGSSTRGN